ncbi:MAG: hypothetical protein P4M15_00220, partial [Alphaproteobacteria bacterium]|nr:hypothetical protein [Alphaproteobacteria bacterium]
MKYKFAAIALTAAALAAAPLAPAEAHGWDHGHGGYGGGWHDHGGGGWHENHHGGGIGWGVAAGIGAIVGAAATIATAPFVAVGDAFAPAPQPVVYQQQPVYAYPQTYYQPRRVV